MEITFFPIRMDEALIALRVGDILTLNGTALDFTPLPVGATLPRDAIASPWIAGDVSRDGVGVLHIPLVLPHGAGAPETTRFPVPITLTADGPVELPTYDQETDI